MTLIDSLAVTPETFVPTSGVQRGDDATFELALVTFDLYRDVHKGIRSELFALTTTAGNVDPSDRIGRFAVADHVASMQELLEEHAAHEDAVIEPELQRHAPDLAERIAADHQLLESRFATIVELSQAAAGAGPFAQRQLMHALYLELSAFTSGYLAHQLVEERAVMPALEQALGLEAVIDMHQAIVSSIPPALMAKSLSVMLPAMNLDDRAEMLVGMRADAPAEAFAGVVNLARSVLDPTDFNALADRLERV